MAKESWKQPIINKKMETLMMKSSDIHYSQWKQQTVLPYCEQQCSVLFCISPDIWFTFFKSLDGRNVARYIEEEKLVETGELQHWPSVSVEIIQYLIKNRMDGVTIDLLQSIPKQWAEVLTPLSSVANNSGVYSFYLVVPSFKNKGKRQNCHPIILLSVIVNLCKGNLSIRLKEWIEDSAF